MPQPKKTSRVGAQAGRCQEACGGSRAKARGDATAKAKTAAARSAAKPKRRRQAQAPRRSRRPRRSRARTAHSTDELAANLGVLRERLVSSLTLTSDRLQETVDDAVRRGRMTRKDAEELLSTLVTAGRAQTEALLADVEQLLGRGGAGDAVLRTVDRARRRVGAGVGGNFPILGYDDLTAAQITKRLTDLTPAQLRKVRDYERRHDARKSVLAAIERKLG